MAHRRGAAADDPTFPRPFLAGPRSRPLALLLALLGTFLLGGTLAALPVPALAVTPVASEPRARQELGEVPGSVTLAFSRDVDPSVAKIVVLDADGTNVTSGPLIVEGTNVTSQLRDGLDRGTYTVHFRVDGRDGEPEGGAYQFSYGDGRFTDLPDRSWSGEDDEPAVLSGTNPNGSEEPDPPSTQAANTPGIEVTSQAASSEPPPPTDPPATVSAPPGPTDEETSEAAGAPGTSVSATPAPGGSSGAPWVVGGVVLLLAVAGAGYGVWRRRAAGGAGAHD